jgi:hypothetical protein
MPATDWAPWAARVPSTLADHGTACCAEARAWFLAMDRAMWRGQGGPAWIRRRWDWGPTQWPLHWCEAVEAKELCCGAQAALSLAAFRARAIEAIPVQLVQRYQAHDVPHWHSRWTRGGANPGWAADGFVYHEVCAVLDADGRLRVWNPTATAWVSPENVSGYGSIVAIRAGGATPDGRAVTWGVLQLPLGEWTSTADAATAAH